MIRREFMRTCGRGGLGMVLALLTCNLGRRTVTAMKEGRCINEGMCRQCRLFEECKLPRATRAQKERRQKGLWEGDTARPTAFANRENVGPTVWASHRLSE